MGREFELKYRADSAFIARIREKYGDFTAISMETVYYDTPDLALSRRRWTLRRRYENGTAVCTLKTPAPEGSRGEWELPCDSLREAVPELCKLGAPEELLTLTADALQVTCGARFTRLAKTIPLPDAILELALDQGVLIGGGKEAPFAEVEAELKEGSEDAVRAFAQALAAEFGLTEEPNSKHKRAMLLNAAK